jgi:hypothetical protein
MQMRRTAGYHEDFIPHSTRVPAFRFECKQAEIKNPGYGAVYNHDGMLCIGMIDIPRNLHLLFPAKPYIQRVIFP